MRQCNPSLAGAFAGKLKDGKDAFTMVACESEWHFSGVRGGIMDQFTSMHAVKGRAFIIDCRKSLIHEKYIRIPAVNS